MAGFPPVSQPSTGGYANTGGGGSPNAAGGYPANTGHTGGGYGRLDQQGHGGGITSDAAGGAPKMNMNLLFFIASCCVIISGLFGTLSTLLTVPIAPFDLVDEVYLFTFGGLMFVLDAPLNFKAILEVKAMICKYVRLLTRFTGRGVFYVFLGCMSFGTLWRAGWLLTAVVFGFYVVGLGVYAAVMGGIKSKKLERLRKSLAHSFAGDALKLDTLYRHYAATPRQGMSKPDFNEMATELAGIKFDAEELTFVFNALSTRSTAAVYQEDLAEWAAGGMSLL